MDAMTNANPAASKTPMTITAILSLRTWRGVNTVPGKGVNTNVRRLGGSSWSTGTNIKATEFDGVLGYDILKHFVVTVDYKRSLLHLHAP